MSLREKNTENRIVVFDLTKNMSNKVKLIGMSDPVFDGVNYYRIPKNRKSGIQFDSGINQLIKIEYQLYSSEKEISTLIYLNGKLLGERKFMPGKFGENFIVSYFSEKSSNNVEIEYKCTPDDCDKSLHQYWTRVVEINDSNKESSHSIGFNAKKIISYAPYSPLSVNNAGYLDFDGKNYMRKIVNSDFRMEWSNLKVKGMSAYIYSSQTLKVSAIVQGKTVAVQQGDKDNGIPIALSLARFPEARSVSFRVECLGLPVKTGCAYLYFPEVSVSTAPSVSMGTQLGVVVLVMLGLSGLWAWLRPVPVSGGGSFR